MNWIPPEINSQSLHYGREYINAFQGPENFFLNNQSLNYQHFDQPQYQNSHLNNQRKMDQDFINNFISNIKLNKKDEGDQICKINKAKSTLLGLIAQKQQLECEVCNLDANCENFDTKWDDVMNQVKDVNEKILNFDSNIKSALKIAIFKRRKKRENLKKRKAKYKKLKEQFQEDVKCKDMNITKLMGERHEEVETIKREASLKRQADSVLHEVRKKKYEAKKMLNMLSALSKLRELRSKKEEEAGGYCSKQLTQTFNEVINRFQELWEKQSDVYKLEEKGLRIMLEESALPHSKESKFEMNMLQWEKVLFGDVSNNENEKLLTIADSDIQVFIQVRRDWDQFIKEESTAMTTSIPPGWILPPETGNEDWKEFTKVGKSVLEKKL